MKWVTFIGEGRSGHTIVSAILGSHPHGFIGEERKSISRVYREHWTKEQIINDVLTSGMGKERKTKGFDEKMILTHKEPLLFMGDKCFGVDTPILMYDGSIRKIQNVVVGDKLMGPDSLPRTVNRLVIGKDKLYSIVPKRDKGISWKCNSNHILVLKGKDRGVERELEISVKNYLSYRGSFYKMFKASVCFESKPVVVDPYFVGLWLGDGRKNMTGRGVEITNIDTEIIEYLRNFARDIGYKVHTCKTGVTHYISPLRSQVHGFKDKNWLLDEMKQIDLELYAVNSEKVRLKFLAGIIDSDGHYQNNRYFLIRQKNKKYADLIEYAARSLGFGVSVKLQQGRSQTGYTALYYRISIFGDIWRIPTLIKRKQAVTTKRKQDQSIMGFRINDENIVDDFYGITVNADGRFLLGDFTVVHNCGWDSVNEYTKRNAPKDIINQFGSVMGMPVKVIVTLRNPLDNISSWYVSSKYKRMFPDDNIRLKRMARRYRRFHWAAVELLEEVENPFLWYNEEAIKHPIETIQRLSDWLELPRNDKWIEYCASKLFSKPHERRQEFEWPEKYKKHMADFIKENPLMGNYK